MSSYYYQFVEIWVVFHVPYFKNQVGESPNFSGFVWVMENLESHGILEFDFPGLESHGNCSLVMESHGK